MYDVELVREILNQILLSTKTVAKRFASIASPEDFTISEKGLEKLDAICMQLIAIGESVKNLDKVTEGKLLSQYPQVTWNRVKGMRDILTHHYFDLDAEVVYSVCDTHIEELAQTIQRMITDLEDC
ncbi:antitoxin [candidate division LCP-89 bacterium B3_LCP]|uniref:Antitoxin n=1 Tax=candidate division LCP-89 bacterium B3_LCP TaxID=2012998 RepID=A0A532USP2_UNCL8|nr:MAG: antitoxin [candidate division LCP-89 bacterium B3_LCP]